VSTLPRPQRPQASFFLTRTRSPCVGCNDDSGQRRDQPWKLYNQRNKGNCKKYRSSDTDHACLDACKTQWVWCESYAWTLDNERKRRMRKRCWEQFKDCHRVNKNLRDPGWCKAEGKDEHVQKPWFGWLDNWLDQWQFEKRKDE